MILAIHLLVTLALVGLVLLQTSKGGLGPAFGSFEHYRTKRGAERVVFMVTIIVSILFLMTSTATILLR